MSMSSAIRLKRIHPKKFALWTALVSIVMLFSALTSAYLVRRAASDWLIFPIPQEFFISTTAIVLSSIVLHLAYRQYVNKKYSVYITLLVFGFGLGMLFMIYQYLGWLALNDMQVFLHTNQSSSFTGMLVGIHALHIIGGLTGVLVCLIHALRKKTREWTPKRQLRLELVFTYWHFVDFVWIYLIIFFYTQQ